MFSGRNRISIVCFLVLRHFLFLLISFHIIFEPVCPSTLFISDTWIGFAYPLPFCNDDAVFLCLSRYCRYRCKNRSIFRSSSLQLCFLCLRSTLPSALFLFLLLILFHHSLFVLILLLSPPTLPSLLRVGCWTCSN